MDVSREAHLARILENRRQRGALKSFQPADPPVNPVPQAAPPPPPPPLVPSYLPSGPSYQAPPAVASVPSRQEPRQATYNPPPMHRNSPHRQVTASANGVSATVIEQQQKLREAQALQERKVDQLQQDLRKGLSGIQRTLEHVIAGQSPLAGSTSARHRNSGAGRILEGLSARNDDRHLVSTPVGGTKHRRSGAFGRDSMVEEEEEAPPPEPNFTTKPMVVGCSIIPSAANMASAPTIPYFEGTSAYQQQLQRQASSRNARASNSTMVAASAAVMKPIDAPIVARPFTKTTIDTKSSLTILREGDWWYKWDHTGSKVHLRWVWLDPTRCALSWTEKKTVDAPMFCPRIMLEDIQSVQTTQIVEHDSHGNPRVFYVLLITCTGRLLQLASERREKLDVWYESLNNLIHSMMALASRQMKEILNSD